jgi:hypothetical protein
LGFIFFHGLNDHVFYSLTALLKINQSQRILATKINFSWKSTLADQESNLKKRKISFVMALSG